MNRIIGGTILLLCTMFLFGCIGGQQEYVTEEETTPIQTGQPPAQTEQPQPLIGCEPEYTVSDLPAKGTIGQTVQLSVTATCAKNRLISLNIDQKQESGGTVPTDEEMTFNFILNPQVEGTKRLVVWSNEEEVYSKNWEVGPLGSADISGTKNDPVSSKEWIATRFDVSGSLNVKSVGAYMKRLYSQTLAGSEVIAEIRADDNGVPSANYIAATTIPITKPTLTENWIYLNYPEGVQLSPGRYWVVFKVMQENDEQIVSDVVNIHYTFSGDTTIPGSDYNRKMNLVWDNSQRKYVETSWEPRAYARTYSVVLSGEEHS